MDDVHRHVAVQLREMLQHPRTNTDTRARAMKDLSQPRSCPLAATRMRRQHVFEIVVANKGDWEAQFLREVSRGQQIGCAPHSQHQVRSKREDRKSTRLN